jgi:histidinol-phosphate aminotransferase
MIKTNKRLDLINEYKPSNRLYGGDIKKLDWNECNLKFDNDFKKILFDSLSDIIYSEYPNIDNKNLIKKLSDYCNVNINNIQTFNGSDSALHYIFATFLNRETNVLIFYPNYNQIESYIKLYCDKINYSKIHNPFDSHSYLFEDIKNNDVIYLSNPNNPTGYCLEPIVIEELLKQYKDKLFIIDEAYYEFSKKSCSELTKKYDNIIVTRTFSKAFSLASIRFGYICADNKLLKQINKIRNTKEVNSFAQKLAEVALDNNNYIQERIDLIIKNREKFESVLEKNNISFIKSESNFILIKVNDSKTIINKLNSEKILVRDRGMFDGFENTIRITIGDWDDMEKILKIILEENEYK